MRNIFVQGPFRSSGAIVNESSHNGCSRSTLRNAGGRSQILMAGIGILGLLVATALLPFMTACNGGPMPFVTAFSCASTTFQGTGQVSCTVTLNGAARGGGQGVNLVSSSSAVVVPPSMIVPGSAASANFMATITPVPTAQTVTLTAAAGGFSRSIALNLDAANPTISASPATLAFGQVMENSSATQTVTLTSVGQLPLTITGATATGVGYSVATQSYPVTLNPNQSLTLTVAFDPTTVGPVNGNLIVASNSSTGSSTVIALTGTGLAAVGVSVVPSTVQVNTGEVFQFAANVTGTTNNAVMWSVSGSGCSGSACGTIDATGLYTAPAAAPNPATVNVTATSQIASSASGSAVVTIVQSTGKTYYLAPSTAGGADTNDGLTPSTPWVSPNHAVNCGDVIIAAASTDYQYWNFNSGNWGTVTCSSGSGVAWLECATFDGCKITSGGGILVDQSYWGVQGWEVTATNAYAGCFAAAPNTTTPLEIHHIIFANDVANGCQSGGFISYNSWVNLAASVDYITVVGDIAYNGAQGNTNCYSGISIYEPIQSDAAPGTHIYVAGNFSYANSEPSPCGGYTAPGADGIIFDTFDGSQAGLPAPYAAQAVAENNILVGNNGAGVQVQNNAAGASHAPIYVQNNTSWGNLAGSGTSNALCSELVINVGYDIDFNNNLVETDAASGCGSHTVFGIQAYNGDTSDTIDTNFVYSAAGNNFYSWPVGAVNFGSDNITGQDPKLANPTVPSAPQCSGTANVPACMATLVTNLTAGNSNATAFGYQPPSSTPVTDSMFPKWLCNVNLPSGLVTMGCQ
jgi:hypothetical protein